MPGLYQPLVHKIRQKSYYSFKAFFQGFIMYSYHLCSVWVHFTVCFQWYMIFVFQSVPTPYSAALLQLGIVQRNYWGTGLLGNTAGDMTGEKAAVKGFLVLRYCWRE